MPALQIIVALAVALASATNAFAACPIERAIYADRDKVAELIFAPTSGAATVTNSFRMALADNVVLDGVVMWTEGVARPNGMLMRECPEGDVTSAELDACTFWQGVIYTSDSDGRIGLLPAEGAMAPPTLILPDLGYSLNLSASEGEESASLPWDVFALEGCRE